MIRYILVSLFTVISSAVISQEAVTHIVNLLPDGSFSPKYLFIRDGDTVQWNFCERSDNIISVDSIDSGPGISNKYIAFNPDDPNEFTGPLPIALSRVFPQSPESTSAGFRAYTLGESEGEPAVFAGNQLLCSNGVDYATMDWTWQQPGITGVNIRLRWNEIFHHRRNEFWPELPDPFPISHYHVFKYNPTQPDVNQVLYYVNVSKPSTERTDNPYGAVLFLPGGPNFSENLLETIIGNKVLCYPDPFEESVSIKYNVQKPGPVEIAILDPVGRMQDVLISSSQTPGDCTIESAGNPSGGVRLLPGVYLLKTTISRQTTVSKIIKTLNKSP